MNTNDVIQKFKNRKPSILGEENYFKSSVLLPLIEKENETHILFEVRSMNLRRQPGDICFPGGRMDKEDQTPLHCAVRETSEELGLAEDEINDVIPLDYVVADMGRIIYPFIGHITNPNNIVPNEDEVGEIFTIPLNYLLQTEPEVYKINVQLKPEDDFPFDLIIGGENYQWQMRHIDEMFYKYNGKVVWGLTAKILNHFISQLK
ncbi:NUDIX hydrolase [Oceanobacillus halophilus]|uniref:CoA pyrophosphatase n=1 Tax=Oceanobacillus halophilus TaxID=930130 RepID=A0A495A212_9BACI|nr:CoA pyrophosphatase [Oceanobacillus halophilus]RKQ33515.1 CoA pyrophosphatase [Oceanobacillus halophilus]